MIFMPINAQPGDEHSMPFSIDAIGLIRDLIKTSHTLSLSLLALALSYKRNTHNTSY